MHQLRTMSVIAAIGLFALTACGQSAEDPPTTTESELTGDETEQNGSNGSEPTAPADGQSERNPQGSLNIAFPYSPTQLDPHKLAVGAERLVIYNVYDRIVRADQDRQLQPMVAEDWSYSGDGSKLTLNIREGITFHDGTKLDADAVVQSLDRARGMEDSTVAANLVAIESVTATDPMTVEITTNKNAAHLLDLLSQTDGAVINPQCIDEGVDLSSGDLNRCGSGPYVVTDFQSEHKVEFQAVDEYWDASAGLIEELSYTHYGDPNSIVNALRAGEADAAMVAHQVRDAAESVPDSKLIDYETESSVTFFINGDSENATKPVRQALSLAIDREAIGNDLLEGTCAPTTQPWGQSNIAYNAAYDTDDRLRADVATAKDILSNAGIADPSIRVSILRGHEPATTAAEAVQAYAAEAGIELQLQSDLSADVGPLLNEGKVDSIMFNIPGQPAPYLWLQRNLLKDGTFARAADGENSDTLIELANRTIDPTLSQDELKAAWLEVNELLQDEAWNVTVCRLVMTMIFPNSIENAESMALTQDAQFDVRYLSFP